MQFRFIVQQYTVSFLWLTLLLLCSSVSAVEEDESSAQWAMGAGLGIFDFHLYPGARQTRTIILPVPYFTYRSKKFEVDRGIKSFLYRSEEIVLDVSMDFGLPVDSDDTQARAGMPDLNFTLQVGPSIEFLLNERRANYFDIRFEIPVRVAIETGFPDINNIGYVIEPRFSFNHRRSERTGIAQKATIGLKFATQDFHAYYYDVAPIFVTSDRPTYESRGGFGGSFAKYRISYKSENFIYWAFMRYQSLRGAVFEDSPLVLQNDYYLIGAGFSWIFASNL